MTSGNYDGFNIATYYFTGIGNNPAYSDFSGMTNITTLLGCPAFVTEANYTLIDFTSDIGFSMPSWSAGTEPPQTLNSN